MPTRTVEERYWTKVDKSAGPDGCWTWAAWKTPLGYGGFFVSPDRRSVYAHRFAYELAHGPVGAALSICHRCDNPSCVNPAHLFAGTAHDNAVDMVNKGRHGTKGLPARRGTCKHGHPWTPENVATFRGSDGKPRTRCRTCQRRSA